MTILWLLLTIQLVIYILLLEIVKFWLQFSSLNFSITSISQLWIFLSKNDFLNREKNEDFADQ